MVLVVLGIVISPTTSYAANQGGQCNGFAGAVALGGSFNDGRVIVPACGPRPNYGGATYGVHPYPGSLVTPGYQCVELSERYLYYAYGVTMGISTNGDQIVDHYAAKYQNIFSSIGNGTVGHAPVQGDVLSFSTVPGFNSAAGGHTAVVQSSSVNSAGNGKLLIVEENASASGTATIGVSGWRVSRSGYPYIKWLHSGGGGGSSPGIGYEVAFQANTGSLWSVGSDTHGDWQQGMMPGTSPSITALSGGGYEMAFQANTGSLITIGAAGNKNWQLGMMPGTSPSITSLNGSFEVAFQANTGSLWSVGSDTHGAWDLGMSNQTSPSIAP